MDVNRMSCEVYGFEILCDQASSWLKKKKIMFLLNGRCTKKPIITGLRLTDLQINDKALSMKRDNIDINAS